MTLKTTDTTDTPGGQVGMLSDVDREMLAALPADERDLIERVLQQDPKGHSRESHRNTESFQHLRLIAARRRIPLCRRGEGSDSGR